jgi:hypothetical protein
VDEAQGVDGADGAGGADRADAADGEDGWDGVDGGWMWPMGARGPYPNSESSLALSFEGKGDSPWNDERTSLLSGQAIQNLDMPWNDERTSLLSGQAIQNFWDKPSIGLS